MKCDYCERESGLTEFNTTARLKGRALRWLCRVCYPLAEEFFWVGRKSNWVDDLGIERTDDGRLVHMGDGK